MGKIVIGDNQNLLLKNGKVIKAKAIKLGDEVIGIEHQNFFEGKATSYMKSGLRGEHGSITFTDIKSEEERSNLD